MTRAEAMKRVAAAIAGRYTGDTCNAYDLAPGAAEAAVEAYRAALAESGFVIHRFHDWQYPPRWPWDQQAPARCKRCGVNQGCLMDATSCGEFPTEPDRSTDGAGEHG